MAGGIAGEVLIAAASGLAGWTARSVRPQSFVRAYNARFRRWWKWCSRNPGGRPRISIAVIAEIHRLCRENPLWGAPRIHGELRKLGIAIAQSTVSHYMLKRPRDPQQGWKTFLDNHAGEIAAIDMLSVPTLAFEMLYVLVVLGHGRRNILHIEVTDHPTAPWLAQQITEAFPWDSAPTYLLRDNDGAYGLVLRRRIRAMGIRDCPVAPHSPWQNGYVERVIGSIRRECLDHMIVFNAAHLRRLLKAYVEYYNNDRTHLGLDKDTPHPRAIETTGAIISRPILGGLHHRYSRKTRK